MREITSTEQAATIVRQGGVIAYPTEAVYGLGCDPANSAAVKRLLKLKRRPRQKGLICVAASVEQVQPWLDLRHRTDIARAIASWPGPITWVLRARKRAPSAVRRDDGTVAVRVSAHPLVVELCNAFGGPIVSTSANPAGAAPARDRGALSYYFGDRIDGVLIGALGDASRPTQIRDARSGDLLRSG